MGRNSWWSCADSNFNSKPFYVDHAAKPWIVWHPDGDYHEKFSPVFLLDFCCRYLRRNFYFGHWKCLWSWPSTETIYENTHNWISFWHFCHFLSHKSGKLQYAVIISISIVWVYLYDLFCITLDEAIYCKWKKIDSYSILNSCLPIAGEK